ncbi:MAG TPA: sugar nucleotide-binding protein [Pseudomonadales bacterium]|nr:sugar nucleotide-binding protein [Pseudomonadales bacterium]
MKILLCGNESPLARAVVFRLEQMPFPFIEMSGDELAAMTTQALEALLRDKHINCLLNVVHLPYSGSARELERRYSRLPQNLALAAASTNCFMLQLSDCQVFSGLQAVAYKETDEPDTQTPYGAMRWAGERAVIDTCPRHLVLRTGELFSSLGDNVLTNLVAAWRAGESAPVSVRYQFCPTAVRDVARVIVALLQQLSCGIEPWGIYHYCGTDAVSYRDFARLVKQILESQPGCNVAMEMREIAEGLTPLSWALDCSKIRETFGIKQHPWRAGLTSAVKRVLVVQDLVARGVPVSPSALLVDDEYVSND